MEEKVRKITKNVFSQCSGEGKATIPFLRTNVISEKNTEKRETYPIYLGSDGMCTAVATILCGGHMNIIKMHGISRHYFAEVKVFCHFAQNMRAAPKLWIFLISNCFIPQIQIFKKLNALYPGA